MKTTKPKAIPAKKPETELVEIEKPVYGGAFLARVEGKALFVPLALAGETTVLFSSHDLAEVDSFASHVGYMDRGRLMQVAPPAEIYEQPNSRWIADFVGNVNLFEGRVGDDGASVEGTTLGRVRIAATIDAEPGTTVWVAVRPEKMRMTHDEPPPDQQTENGAAAMVVDIGYLGDLSIYKLRTADGVAVQAAVTNTGRHTERAIGWDDKVWLSVAPEAAIVLTR